MRDEDPRDCIGLIVEVDKRSVYVELRVDRERPRGRQMQVMQCHPSVNDGHGKAAGGARIAEMRYERNAPSRPAMVRCPTCGDGSMADLGHVAACAAAKVEAMRVELREARRTGAALMLEAVERQIARRGEVVTGTLAAGVLWGRW